MVVVTYDSVMFSAMSCSRSLIFLVRYSISASAVSGSDCVKFLSESIMDSSS